MKRKFDNVSLCSSLYTLTLLYEKVINILDTFSGTLFTTKDHSLNHAYSTLISTIDSIEKAPNFKKLGIQTPPLFESLIGDVEDMDIDWKYNKKYVEEYLAKINTYLTTQCKRSDIKPIKTTKKLLAQADSAIREFKRKYLNKKPLILLTANEKGITEQKTGEGLYHWGKLELNIPQGTIRYDKTLEEISPEIDIIKFLILLFENQRVVEYVELAKYLKLPCYHKECKNVDVARDIQFIKRDLLTFLKKKLGMPEKEVRNMIITKWMVGFKLRQ